jgi:uncharacterized membrane protein YdjX (TVP38/TMEM64 family)
MRRSLPTLLPVLLWLGFAAVVWSFAARHEEGVVGFLVEALAAFDAHPAAPGLLLVAFALRPLTLLPVTVLTAFAGFLLGPVGGFLLALAAVTLTSLVPYAIARAARRGEPGGSFLAVAAARLAMLPGDAVSAVAGVVRVPLTTFLAATALGGAPGVLVGVLAGAGVGEAFEVGSVVPDMRLILGSAAILVLSLLVAWRLRRRPIAVGSGGL